MAQSRARDVMITGLGFCLPGIEHPVLTPADLWSIASQGKTALVEDDGLFYGSVGDVRGTFGERWPEVPGVFADHFSDVQQMGMISLAEACADAKLDVRTDFTEAAILVGRGGIDSNVPPYRALTELDPRTVQPEQAMALFLSGRMSSSTADVALVQGSVTRTHGPCFTAAVGCSSSSVQVNTARLMIEAGEIERAVVTGVDAFNPQLARNTDALIEALQGGPYAGELPPTLSGLMRPYDRRASTTNFGEGSATIVLESRESVERRGGNAYGTILAETVRRDGMPHPLTGDRSGAGLADAIRHCLGDRFELPPYVHGCSDGDLHVTALESAAMAELYGTKNVLMSSQEGCFGHNGAAAGCTSIALTLLMLERGEVCPTANCEEPAEGLSFDPVPGTSTRPLNFDQALALTYQIGGTRSVTLVGSAR